MLYYKVKPESDQVKFKNDRKWQSYCLIKNELFTSKELLKMKIEIPFLLQHFEGVNIKPKQTYFMFGARFEIILNKFCIYQLNY